MGGFLLFYRRTLAKGVSSFLFFSHTHTLISHKNKVQTHLSAVLYLAFSRSLSLDQFSPSSLVSSGPVRSEFFDLTSTLFSEQYLFQFVGARFVFAI